MAFNDKLIAWREQRASREEAFHEWAKKWGLPAAGTGGGFFYEFPHTHTYDSDLSWLIARMLWVLNRMDDVEQRMAALEDLVDNFIESLEIDTLIREAILKMIRDGDFDSVFQTIASLMILRFDYKQIPISELYSDSNILQLQPNTSTQKITISAVGANFFLGDSLLAGYSTSTVNSFKLTNPTADKMVGWEDSVQQKPYTLKLKRSVLNAYLADWGVEMAPYKPEATSNSYPVQLPIATFVTNAGSGSRSNAEMRFPDAETVMYTNFVTVTGTNPVICNANGNTNITLLTTQIPVVAKTI